MKTFLLLLLFCSLTTPFVCIFGGDTFSKIYHGIFLWMVVLNFIGAQLKSRKALLSTKDRLVVFIILILGIFEMIRSIPNGELFTIIGNPNVSMWLLVPIFFYTRIYTNMFYDMLVILEILIVGAFIYFVFGNLIAVEDIIGAYVLYVGYICIWGGNIHRFIIVFGLLLAFAWGLTPNGQRYIFIMICLSIVIFFVCYVLRSKFLSKLYCISICLLPVIFVIWSLLTLTSPFSLLSDYSSDEEMTSDTRTFLYVEILEDISENPSTFLFGKGALGRYHSDYFESHMGDSPERIAVETGVLMVLLKSGFVYFLLYCYLLFHSIWRALKYGRSSLAWFIACILSSHFFMMFIYDVPIFGIKYVFYWIFIMLCMQNDFLSLTDVQLKQYFKK